MSGQAERAKAMDEGRNRRKFAAVRAMSIGRVSVAIRWNMMPCFCRPIARATTSKGTKDFLAIATTSRGTRTARSGSVNVMVLIAGVMVLF